MSAPSSSTAQPIRKTKGKRGFIIAGAVTLVLFAAYLLIAAALIYWPRPTPFGTPDLDMSAFNVAEGRQSLDIEYFQMPDGTRLAARRFGATTDTLVLFMHGVASDQSMLAMPAQMLNQSTGFQIMTIDMRGHGLSDGPRNDVQHIGQYEEDVAEIVHALRADAPDLRIVLAGHSMGGGIAMRYALLRNAPEVAGYLLFAPNFGEGPTGKKANKDAVDLPQDQPPPVFFDVKRMIGQIMMNSIGLHTFDSEAILFFNFPPQPQAYSYRAVMSAQPIRPNTTDKALSKIQVPLLVLVGENDEVFNASAYETFVSQNSDGQTHLVPGESHVSILFSSEAHALAGEWSSNQSSWRDDDD